MSEFKPCVLIPTYNNPATVRDVVERAREHLRDVVVVDDGSGPEARAVLDAVAAEGLAHLHRRAQNGEREPP